MGSSRTLPFPMTTRFISIIIISTLHLPFMAPAGQTGSLYCPDWWQGCLCGDR